MASSVLEKSIVPLSQSFLGTTTFEIGPKFDKPTNQNSLEYPSASSPSLIIAGDTPTGKSCPNFQEPVQQKSLAASKVTASDSSDDWDFFDSEPEEAKNGDVPIPEIGTDGQGQGSNVVTLDSLGTWDDVTLPEPERSRSKVAMKCDMPSGLDFISPKTGSKNETKSSGFEVTRLKVGHDPDLIKVNGSANNQLCGTWDDITVPEVTIPQVTESVQGQGTWDEVFTLSKPENSDVDQGHCSLEDIFEDSPRKSSAKVNESQMSSLGIWDDVTLPEKNNLEAVEGHYSMVTRSRSRTSQGLQDTCDGLTLRDFTLSDTKRDTASEPSKVIGSRSQNAVQVEMSLGNWDDVTGPVTSEPGGHPEVTPKPDLTFIVQEPRSSLKRNRLGSDSDSCEQIKKKRKSKSKSFEDKNLGNSRSALQDLPSPNVQQVRRHRCLIGLELSKNSCLPQVINSQEKMSRKLPKAIQLQDASLEDLKVVQLATSEEDFGAFLGKVEKRGEVSVALACEVFKGGGGIGAGIVKSGVSRRSSGFVSEGKRLTGVAFSWGVGEVFFMSLEQSSG